MLLAGCRAEQELMSTNSLSLSTNKFTVWNEDYDDDGDDYDGIVMTWEAVKVIQMMGITKISVV